MRKLVLLLMVPLMLSACGIKRPLVLPEHDKYKHKKATPDTPDTATPATPLTSATTPPAQPPASAAPEIMPPTTNAPSDTIQK